MFGPRKVPLQHVILDEIALEGLEGISISGLWTRLSDILEYPLPLLHHFQTEVWSFVRNASKKYLLFYELPQPREALKIYHRFKCLDKDLGVPTAPDECPYTRYKCAPVDDPPILGSCEFYQERKLLPQSEIENMSLEDVNQRWGDKFVIVGTQDLRYNSLVPINMPIPIDITPIQYCFWEAIGRSRFNGETTAGKFSLVYWCKDSTIVFYIRNKLLRCGVIEKQPFTEKRADRLLVTCLLTLPRFSTANKTIFEYIIEKIFSLVKESPNKRLPMQHIKTLFSPDKLSTLKRIVLTHFFKKIFNVKNQPLGEFAELLQITPKSKKERQIVVVELRNPELSADDLFSDAVLESEKDDSNVNFFSEKHSFVDMPILERVFRAVERFGDRGCSQTELANYICLNHLLVRQAVKTALAEGIITSRIVDCGRQRTNIFVAANLDSSRAGQEKKADISQKLECAAEPNIPDDPDTMLRDIPTISSRIKLYNIESNQNNKPKTQRQLERQRKIIEAVDELCIVQTTQVRQIITKSEQESGYKDEICSKSLRRLYGTLQSQGLVNTYELILESGEIVRLYRFITHPKIDINHKVIQNEILKLKNRVFLQLEERKLRTRTTDPNKQKVITKDLLPLCFKFPKFLVSRFFHEFLFYISQKLRPSTKPTSVTRDMVQNWQQTEPSLDMRAYMESLNNEGVEILAYTSNINWRTFIPPLPKYEDKPRGWVYIMDAIDRVPLSIFSKIFQIDKMGDSRIKEYATHPIRQHYLIKQLPVDIQAQISRIRLHRMYIYILKVLNNIGLVQMGGRQQKDPLHIWIYMNSKAKVLDTSASEPAYKKINTDKQYAETYFDFKSLEDVRQYWTHLYKICLHTKLGFKGKNMNQECLERIRSLSLLPAVNFKDAPIYDNACIPGDQLGAGGLPSFMYAHYFRNWSWISNTKNPPNSIRTGKPPNRNLRLKQTNVLSQRNSTTKRTVTGTIKIANRVALIPTKRLLQPKKKSKRNYQSGFDSIDKDALKNMSSIRVFWSDEEDHTLKLCRAVYEYLSAPLLVFNLITVSRCARDILRRYLDIYNKTSQACLRRIKFLIKHNRHLPEVPSWLNLLQKHPYLNQHYGDSCYDKLKSLRLSKEDNSAVLAVHFLLIYNFLIKLIDSAEEPEKIIKFKIPNTLDEFHATINERVLLAEQPTLSQSNPSTLTDLQIAIINNVLHSSLCCNRDKTHYTLQIFHIYKFYSEDVLHSAFKKSRDDGLVVNMKKRAVHKQQQLGGPAYIFSCRYRQRLMFLKIPYFAYDQCYEFLNNAIHALFANCQNAYEFKSSNSGTLFAVGECIHLNYFLLDIKFPPSVLTVDPSSQQCVSDPDLILDRFHHIFENTPQTEYLKQYETEQAENTKQQRVKFKMANLSYKIYYNPYDIISKMNNRYVHFFCALKELNEHFDLNRCKSNNECPFHCILNDANYINTIKQIVDNRKMEIKFLLHNNRSDTHISDSEIHTVTRDNLMVIARKMTSILLENDKFNELKDIGKSTILPKTIDWLVICKDLLEMDNVDDDFSKHDEYEPTLNKEERIAKAQDVFVVNLPTISLSPSEQLLETSEKIMYKDSAVPIALVEGSIQRDAIFEKISKEAYWTYTENNINTLQPILDQNKFTFEERMRVKLILKFIESNELGVSASEILNEFQDEQFLIRTINLLRNHFLIKRVGVATFMYVHKSHVRQWVIHTCHIKRLDREAMGKMTVENIASKRKYALIDDDDEDVDEMAVKIVKGVDVDTDMLSQIPSTSKRISKPTQRYEGLPKTVTSSLPTTKDVIALTPCPWLRVNGSLNRRVLDRLMGTIINDCIAWNGILVHSLCSKFRQMQPVNIMFLLELLSDLKCIKLKRIRSKEADLFSDDTYSEEIDATELTAPEETFVIVAPDAMMRLSMFIGDKKYSTEFI